MSDPQVVRIGILGAAGIAPRALINPARSVDEVAIVAVAARDRGRATEFAAEHGIPKVHDSYESLLADPEVDVVYNPTPNGLHGFWTLAAVAAGKHVLCEKPFTANASEARKVADVVATTDRIVMEAFHYRYHPITLRTIEILRSGELGKLVSVESGFGGMGPARDDIRWNLALAGGTLMDVGCYPVHLLRSVLAEEPKVVSATAEQAEPGVDGDMTIDLEFSGGVVGKVRSSMVSPEPYIYARFTGEDGELEVHNPFLPQDGNSLTIRTGKATRAETTTTEPTFVFQLHALANAVLRGAPVLTSVDDAIKNMDVIDAAYLAAGLEPREPSRA
ncbi:MAG TPA: Gfo/Idh/MocA family oxidoreductase [Galbitalea sp.]